MSTHPRTKVVGSSSLAEVRAEAPANRSDRLVAGCDARDVTLTDSLAAHAPLELIRAPRWPRQRFLANVLCCTLVLALGGLLAMAQPDLAGAGVALGLGVALSWLARLAFEAPLRQTMAEGVLGWTAAAVRSATLVAPLGWLAAWLLNLSLPLASVAQSWALCVAVLVSAAGLRRAEATYGIGSRLFFVGTADQLADLRAEVSRRGDLDVVGHRHIAKPVTDERLVRDLRNVRATVLVLSEDAIRSAPIVAAATQVNLTGVRVRDLRSFYELEFDKVAASEIPLAWFLFDIAAIHRRRLYGTAKRVIEAITSGVLLATCAPLFPIIAVAIRLTSPGAVFFRQTRVGRDGRCFTLAKFRTMRSAPGAEHGHWAGAATDRVTPVGRILRRLRIDELPQLLSVLKGDMSLVGPRPEQPAIVARLERQMQFYAARHVVRPGLTGWAQVNHGYGGSDAGALAKLQYDLFYIKRQSLALDLRIMASTARAILLRDGS